MRYYLDSSAAAKLMVAEPESVALAELLDAAVDRGDQLLSSLVLETEVRRLAVRFEISQETVTNLLDRLELLVPDRALLRDAGMVVGRHLRSLDALHIAAALRLNAASMITYDARQADSARLAGLRVLAPA